MVMSVSECLCRVNTLKRQFKHLYVVVVVSTGEQIESFNQSYFKYAPDIMLNVKCLFWLSHCYLCGSHSRYGMELGCPTFVPVCDPEMGFEKIVRIAHARGGTSLHTFLKFPDSCSSPEPEAAIANIYSFFSLQEARHYHNYEG